MSFNRRKENHDDDSMEMQELTKDHKRKVVTSFSSIPETYFLRWLPPFLPTVKDLCRLSQVNRTLYGFFNQNIPGKNFNKFLTHCRLLHHVLLADPKKVDKLLNRVNPDCIASLILDKTQGTEENGRKWEAISPLAHTVWSGDTFLRRKQLLPRLRTLEDKEKALKILEQVRDKGTEHGMPLTAFKSLIDEYQTLKNNYANWNNYQRNKHCINKIGGGQKNLPMNGLQEYFDKKPFDPLPKFDKESSRLCYLYDGFSLIPFHVNSGLSRDFYLYKGQAAGPGGRVYDWRHRFGCARRDRLAMSQFCKVRTSDLEDDIKELHEQIADLKRKCASRARNS